MLNGEANDPRRHVDGGNHLADGRFGARVGQKRRELVAIAEGIGRSARQRTTTYAPLAA